MAQEQIPTTKHIAYEMPGVLEHTFTCKPAPSSRAADETEEQWLERTIARFVPAGAINVHIEND